MSPPLSCLTRNAHALFHNSDWLNWTSFLAKSKLPGFNPSLSREQARRISDAITGQNLVLGLLVKHSAHTAISSKRFAVGSNPTWGPNLPYALIDWSDGTTPASPFNW